MATKHGVKFQNKFDNQPFSIADNPVSETQPPSWLQSWQFESEHIALFVLHLFLAMSHGETKVQQSDFQFAVKASMRVAGIKSCWAE